MVAVPPTFHSPALLAKQAANIDRIIERAPVAQRRVVVVGVRGRTLRRPFDQHDDRYARTAEWLEVVDGDVEEPAFSLHRAVLHHR